MADVSLVRESIDPVNLGEYVDGICRHGSRYAGSEAERKVRDYIVNRLKEFGYEVAVEEFDYTHYQPESEGLEVVSPCTLSLPSMAMAYSGNGSAEGDAVYVGTGRQEEFEALEAQGVDYRGKIVVASAALTFLAYPRAQERGAAGFVAITDPPENLIRTASATGNLQPGTIPGVTCSIGSGHRMLGLLSTGRLRLRVTSQGEYSKKTSWNMIVTRPGRIESNKHVIVCAHYDSQIKGLHAWDNATGCASVLELARCLKEIPTEYAIRLIFFGVRELGLCSGSKSYVEAHRHEIDDVLAVLPIDGCGTPFNPVHILQTTPDIRDFAYRVAGEMNWRVDWTGDPPPLSDHVPFQELGVPVIWVWDGPASPYHHTEKDVPETVDPVKLTCIAAVAGECAVRIANGEAGVR